jgi:hypothetical protein
MSVRTSMEMKVLEEARKSQGFSIIYLYYFVSNICEFSSFV